MTSDKQIAMLLTKKEKKRWEDICALGTDYQQEFARNVLKQGWHSDKQARLLVTFEEEIRDKYTPKPRSRHTRSYGMDHDDCTFHTGCRSMGEFPG